MIRTLISGLHLQEKEILIRLTDLGLENAVWKAAALLDAQGGMNAIVGGLDSQAVRQRGIYDQVYGYGKEGHAPKLVEFLKKSKAKKIAINISDDFGFSDGLTPGMLGYLKKCVLRAGGKRKACFCGRSDYHVACPFDPRGSRSHEKSGGTVRGGFRRRGEGHHQSGKDRQDDPRDV